MEADYCPRCGSDDGAETWTTTEIVSGGYITERQTGKCACGCIVATADHSRGRASDFVRSD